MGNLDFGFSISNVLSDNEKRLIDLGFLCGKVSGQLIHFPYKKLLKQAILTDEIRCLFATELIDYSFEEIICATNSRSYNDIKQKYQAILEGQKLIDNVFHSYQYIPASDYFEIHNSLSNNKFSISNELSNNFSRCLSALYIAETRIEKLVHLVSILYKSSTNDFGVDFHPICKNILLSYAIDDKFDMLSYGITRERLRKPNIPSNAENIVSINIDILLDAVFTKGYFIIELQNEMSLLLEVVTKKFTKALQ